MKISLNWISSFCDIKDTTINLWPKSLAHKYSIYTAEIEWIEYFWKEDKVVVWKILEAKPHPDSDHLNVVQVDLWNLWKTQIVCWAPNVLSAKYVPVATVWSVLWEWFEIKSTKLRWQESNWMICSADELGFQEERSEGILKLEEIFWEETLEKQIWKPFFEMSVEIPWINSEKFEVKLKDVIFEIDNKFITNRPDLFSISWNAREFWAIFDLDYSFYKSNLSNRNNTLWTRIESDKVLSYNLYKVSNVQALKSPFAISYMLHKSWINAKFDLVDMTNYIMTELGQPMHTFDSDKIEWNICVRQAKDWEEIEALNGEKYELRSSDIVIADDKKVLAIAWIIWWAYSAISEITKNIYIESACFDPVSVRLTAQRLSIRTDSSTRYEKSLDPLLAEIALSRSEDFLKFLWKDYKIEGSSFYLNKEKVNDIKVDFSREFVEKKIWTQIAEKEFDRILNALWFVFEKNWNDYTAQVPSWRATKDISIKEDIAEEIWRIYWYEKVLEVPVSGEFTIKNKNKLVDLKDKIKDYFNSKWFLESYNYSFSNEIKDEKIWITNHSDSIKIANAFNSEFTILRRNMLPNILDNVAENLKIENNFSFYEVWKIHKKNDNEFLENLCVAWISYNEDFNKIKSSLVWFLETIIPWISFTITQKTNLEDFPYFHPNKSGQFVLENDEKLITFWYINPIVASNFDLDDSKIIYFEINFQILFENYIKSSSKFSEISRFPWIDRELNFVMDEKIAIWDISEQIKWISSLIRNIKILDIYRNNEKIWENKKSVTFSILILDFEKTITDEVALDIQNKIIDELKRSWISLRA